MVKVILVHSYKGGSGKTLTSINLAQILAKNSKVLLIEADIFGPLYTNTFDENDPDVYFNQYLSEDGGSLEKYIYKSNHQFDLIYASPKFETNDFLQMQNYEKILMRTKNIKKEFSDSEYDYIILDLAPGVNYLSISSIMLCDTIFILLRPDQNSIEGTIILMDKVYANIFKTKSKEFHLIFNQIPDHSGFEDFLNEWKFLFNRQYDFISSISSIDFHPETSYNFVNSQIVLPESDPTVVELQQIVNNHFN